MTGTLENITSGQPWALGGALEAPACSGGGADEHVMLQGDLTHQQSAEWTEPKEGNLGGGLAQEEPTDWLEPGL